MNSVPAFYMKSEKQTIRAEEICWKIFVTISINVVSSFDQPPSITCYATSLNYQHIAPCKRTFFLFFFCFLSSTRFFPGVFNTLPWASPSDLGLAGWSSCDWRHHYCCAHRAYPGLPEEKRNFWRDTALAHRKWRLQQCVLSVQFLEASGNSVMLLRC